MATITTRSTTAATHPNDACCGSVLVGGGVVIGMGVVGEEGLKVAVGVGVGDKVGSVGGAIVDELSEGEIAEVLNVAFG